jgi:hypothetical protein
MDDDVYRGSINLDTLKVRNHRAHSNKIEIDEDTGILMRYPSFIENAELENVSDEKELEDKAFELVMKCVEKIYDKDKIYTSIDFSPEELKDWINDLPHGSIEKFRSFFDTMPYISETVKLKSKDGNEKEYTIGAISDFFI